MGLRKATSLTPGLRQHQTNVPLTLTSHHRVAITDSKQGPAPMIRPMWPDFWLGFFLSFFVPPLGFLPNEPRKWFSPLPALYVY